VISTSVEGLRRPQRSDAECDSQWRESPPQGLILFSRTKLPQMVIHVEVGKAHPLPI